MFECEFINRCRYIHGTIADNKVALEETKKKYCHKNNLNCARFMIVKSLGQEHIDPDLAPGETTAAYRIIAEHHSESGE